MNKLLLIISTLLMAAPAIAHNGYNHNHRGQYSLGLEILQDLKGIPKQRLRELGCRQHSSSRNLCRIERVRKRTAQRNIDLYNGGLRYVKNAILADINDRRNRRHHLQCGSQYNNNRELCRYEKIVLNELRGVFLVDINQAIYRHNRQHDRIDRERRERQRRDRIERERRREKERRDRIQRERREQERRDRIKRDRRDRERDRVKRDRKRRDDGRRKPGKKRRRPKR